MAFYQTYYEVKHPEKYIGGNVPFARSGWELSFMEYFDNNPQIVRWGSENVIIPYIKPTDNKVHRYVMDFYVEYRDTSGNERIEIIEVKPISQTRRSRSRNATKRIAEDVTFLVNQAKWRAALAYAAERGWKFRVLTEKGDISLDLR